MPLANRMGRGVGLIRCFRRSLRLVWLIAAAQGTVADSQPANVITSVQQVRSLSPVAASQGLAVRLKGVITLVDPGHFFFFVQDETGGIYVRTREAPAVKPREGLDVVGFPVASIQKPFLDDATVRHVGRGRPVTAVDATPAGLYNGEFDSVLVRDDKGYWSQLEAYLGTHSDVLITHGICPDCMKRLYPGCKVSQKSPAAKG